MTPSVSSLTSFLIVRVRELSSRRAAMHAKRKNRLVPLARLVAHPKPGVPFLTLLGRQGTRRATPPLHFFPQPTENNR